MTRGFVIMAQGSDYVKCANTLSNSILRVMPDANITVVKTEDLPYGDQAPDTNWKLQNDWQVYEASPYDETIKIEADMYIPRNIDHWWSVLGQQDVVVCTKIRNFKGEISTQRLYRRFIDDNELPDTYNAITYFRKSETAEKFYGIVRNVFENWDQYKAILKCSSTEKATTDWAYAIASHIIGQDKTTMPNFDELSMIHMKQYINATATENWTDTLVYEVLPDQIRINSHPQIHPLHYHVKTFYDKIDKGMTHGK